VQLRNIGHLDWTVDRYYGLRLIEKGTWTAGFVRLPQNVTTSQVATFTLPSNILTTPGLYASRWQLATPFESFGPPVPVNAVVVPRGATALKKQIQPLLDRLSRLSDKSFEAEWPKTAQKVQQMIEEWAKEDLD
jgi:hypothetical protein